MASVKKSKDSVPFLTFKVENSNYPQHFWGAKWLVEDVIVTCGY